MAAALILTCGVGVGYLLGKRDNPQTADADRPATVLASSVGTTAEVTTSDRVTSDVPLTTSGVTTGPLEVASVDGPDVARASEAHKGTPATLATRPATEESQVVGKVDEPGQVTEASGKVPAEEPVAEHGNKPTDQPGEEPAEVTGEEPVRSLADQPTAPALLTGGDPSGSPTTVPATQPQENASTSPSEATNDHPDDAHSRARDKRVVLYQEIEIQRKPTFTVQGLTIPQRIHYRILSRIEIEPPREDATRNVLQYIEDTRLEEADELSRATFTESLKQLKHQQYTFKLNPRGEVIEFEGHAKNLAALPVEMLGGKGFQLTSVIDKDGWKELAELTCFQPVGLGTGSKSLRREMHHDWEPLGSWYGTTTFRGKGKVGSSQRIEYVHEMAYVAPQQNQGGLPFQITGAEFKTNLAGGTILYDPQLERVTQVQEQFDVAGAVATRILGQDSIIQLREQQLLMIRLTDRRPTWQP